MRGFEGEGVAAGKAGGEGGRGLSIFFFFWRGCAGVVRKKNRSCGSCSYTARVIPTRATIEAKTTFFLNTTPHFRRRTRHVLLNPKTDVEKKGPALSRMENPMA